MTWKDDQQQTENLHRLITIQKQEETPAAETHENKSHGVDEKMTYPLAQTIIKHQDILS